MRKEEKVRLRESTSAPQIESHTNFFYSHFFRLDWAVSSAHTHAQRGDSRH